jgi:hypothetical protein
MSELGSHSVAVALLAQLRRARDHIDRNYRVAMITSVSGNSTHWVRGSAGSPSPTRIKPELQLTLMTPGPPLDAEAPDLVRRQLEKVR